jgi:hypothetical protein
LTFEGQFSKSQTLPEVKDINLVIISPVQQLSAIKLA